MINLNLDIVINKVINAINLGNTIVFCGAGISRNSGLPVVNQFLPYLLSKLEVSKDDIQLILDSENNPKTPFELFIKTLIRHSKIDNIFNIYEQGTPNTNHILLAKLVKAGKIKTIVTTNFDKLIEKALDYEGMNEGKHYDLIYSEDDFNRIDWLKDRIRIVKIHGSIDDKQAMAITINQVASSQLSLPRRKIINYVFSEGKHDCVLILGYSCSDIFDLTPQIESISHNHKKVYYLQHSYKFNVEDISIKLYKNPFINYKGSLRLSYDTDKLVEKIWKSALNSEYELKNSVTNWEASIDNWYIESINSYTDAIKYIIPGEIYSYVTEFKTAEKYFKNALQIVMKEGHTKIEGILRGNLGNMYHAQKKYIKAIFFYYPALRIARKQGDKISESSWLGGIGNVFYSRLKYKKAISYYKQALEISKQFNDIENEGKWLGSLGNVFYSSKDYDNSIFYYDQAIKSARLNGDKKSEGAWLGNLGNVLKALGNKDAKKFYSKALEIAKQIRDKQNEDLWSKNLRDVNEKM